MIFRYLTTLHYPAPYANRTQVIKMSEAFAAKSDFALFVARLHDTKDNVFASYGVTHPFRIEELGEVRLWPRSFWYALRLRSRIAAELPDTIFYIRDVLLAFFLILVSPRFRKNFYFEIHSLEKFPDFVYRAIFRRARGIISTNQAKKMEIERRRPLAPTVLAVPNGVDVDFFSVTISKEEARKKLSLPLDKKIIMYIGSNQSWKGTDMVRVCAEKMPECLFVVVGAEFAGTANLRSYPHVPFREIPAYMRAADFLIAPYPETKTISRLWTSPLKVLEYMASSVPIIASDLPSIRELLDEASALLAKPVSEDGFVSGIRWALAHENEMKEKAERAATRVTEFSWERRAEKIFAFIARTP